MLLKIINKNSDLLTKCEDEWVYPPTEVGEEVGSPTTLKQQVTVDQLLISSKIIKFYVDLNVLDLDN